METTKALYNYLKENCPQLSEIEVKEHKFNILDEQVIMLKECLVNLYKEGHHKYVNNVLNDIINKPTYENGKIYEVLVYDWLNQNKIRYSLQPQIKKEDCFKSKSDYEADGCISGVIFDVKMFGIGMPIFEKVKEEFQKLAYEDNKRITINYPLDLSYENGREMLENKKDIFLALKSEDNKTDDYYRMKWKYGVELCLYPIGEFVPSFSRFNSCEWAKNNELYFVKHGSQFCRNKPYMIFCPFDDNIFPLLPKDEIVYQYLRLLCRRMFINVSRFSDRMLHDFDGKAVNDCTLSSAMRKVSAIIFMNVSRRCNNMWVFVNPNADNPIRSFQIETWFYQKGAYVEDFLYDNY